MRIGTRAIHAGSQPDASSGAIIPPITLSTTFERGHEHIYSRASNPNRQHLERAIAALEDAKFCIAYSSGMAAISSVFGLLQAGDRITSIAALYGGTAVYLNQIAPILGIHCDYVNDFELFEVSDRTKLVWLETPTNPTMKVTDIARLAGLCQARGIMLAVDNTFSSPIIVRPLSLGADIVVHSATKYLNGHADVTMGVLSTNNEEVYNTLRFRQNLQGTVPSPFDCWLCQRGLKTLHLRVRQSSASALKIAKFLEAHPKVSLVNYPSLETSPDYSISTKQNDSQLGGGMLSFRIKGGLEAAERVCSKTMLFKFAVSLGGVESLIEIPATAMTHRSLSKEVRDNLGIYEDLIRISVGCEETEDLLEDLADALE